MHPLRALAVAVIAVSQTAWAPSALAQPVQLAQAGSLAQAERAATALRQGMSSGEVHKLLGKPRHTALRDVGLAANSTSPGTLQWIYSWEAPERGNLRVDFASRAPDVWVVARWEWASY